MNQLGTDEEPYPYIIRVRERAKRDITQAYVRLAEITDEEIAASWRDGLYERVAGLTQFPRRCPRVPERFTTEVRQLLYQRSGSRMTYRILFTLLNEEPDALEPPTVMIMHIRHGAARAMTRREIWEIEGAE